MDSHFSLINVKFVCKYFLGLDWFLDIEDEEEFMEVIRIFASKLEISYMLGALYYVMGKMGKKRIDIWVDYIEDGLCLCIEYTYQKAGVDFATQFYFRPQYRSKQKVITHDIAIYTQTETNLYTSPREINTGIQFVCAIEIDGYNTHRDRRDKDRMRDRGLKYKVVRLREELTEAHTWARTIVEEFSEAAASTLLKTCPHCKKEAMCYDFIETDLELPYCSACMKDLRGFDVEACDKCGTLIYAREELSVCSSCWEDLMRDE